MTVAGPTCRRGPAPGCFGDRLQEEQKGLPIGCGASQGIVRREAKGYPRIVRGIWDMVKPIKS